MGREQWLDGVLVGVVAYGVHATLFFTTLTLLWHNKRKNSTWIAYICVLFITSSIASGSRMRTIQLGFINERNYPGGPWAWITQLNPFPHVISMSAYLVNAWFQNGLLLYRMWIITGRKTLLIAFPGLGQTIYDKETISDQASWEGWEEIEKTFNYTAAYLFTAYIIVAVAFNVLLTAAIAAKLLIVRERLGNYLRDDLGKYVTASAILIESAAMYSVIGIVFVVFHGTKNPIQNLVLPTLSQVQSIASLLIIMRIAQDLAWSPAMGARVSTARNSTWETRITSSSALKFPKTSTELENEQHADAFSLKERLEV
ncbi:hypothetical protein EXIGLDRAFT_769907 [Exidia glandulosa HHB12029]|uniref:Uncharacterized protein n=1 Tax=Exidia glandulosa HHB12029 TaxID=1314781 RepID=A0A165H551_EXIGL|nr:hypothetical protein EXIGLDRAFT_769907 [Exidia glandulosa HHB12029]